MGLKFGGSEVIHVQFKTILELHLPSGRYIEIF